jgi:hypothetical protein
VALYKILGEISTISPVLTLRVDLWEIGGNFDVNGNLFT